LARSRIAQPLRFAEVRKYNAHGKNSKVHRTGRNEAQRRGRGANEHTKQQLLKLQRKTRAQRAARVQQHCESGALGKER
jgi:hypothetical protein